MERKYNIGNTIKIINMKGEDGYRGKVGIIEQIDDAGQLHGTWGGLALIPEEDDFIVLENVNNN